MWIVGRLCVDFFCVCVWISGCVCGFLGVCGSLGVCVWVDIWISVRIFECAYVDIWMSLWISRYKWSVEYFYV